MSHSNAVWIFSPLERARELCIIALRKRKYKTTTLTHSTPGIVYISAAHERKITTQDHSHRIRGRCLVPRPGNVVPIRGSGSKRVSVPFKVGSCPGLKGVGAPLLADLIGIRRLRTVDWCGFCYT